MVICKQKINVSCFDFIVAKKLINLLSLDEEFTFSEQSEEFQKGITPPTELPKPNAGEIVTKGG